MNLNTSYTGRWHEWLGAWSQHRSTRTSWYKSTLFQSSIHTFYSAACVRCLPLQSSAGFPVPVDLEIAAKATWQTALLSHVSPYVWKRQTIQYSEPFSLDSSFCLWQVPLLSVLVFVVLCKKSSFGSRHLDFIALFVSSRTFTNQDWPFSSRLPADRDTYEAQSAPAACGFIVHKFHNLMKKVHQLLCRTCSFCCMACWSLSRSIKDQLNPEINHELPFKPSYAVCFICNVWRICWSSLPSFPYQGFQSSQKVYPDLPWSLGPASFWKSMTYSIDLGQNFGPARSLRSFQPVNWNVANCNSPQLDVETNWKMVSIARNLSAGDLTSILQLPGIANFKRNTFWNRFPVEQIKNWPTKFNCLILSCKRPVAKLSWSSFTWESNRIKIWNSSKLSQTHPASFSFASPSSWEMRARFFFSTSLVGQYITVFQESQHWDQWDQLKHNIIWKDNIYIYRHLNTCQDTGDFARAFRLDLPNQCRSPALEAIRICSRKPTRT